jgi:ankyrin repeat protein
MKYSKQFRCLIIAILAVSTAFFACKSSPGTPNQETQPESMWTLLAAGDERARNFFIGEFDVRATDINGRTPLHYAAEQNDPALAAFFIARGADLNAEDDTNQTPLGICAEKNNLLAAEVIAGAGADIHKPYIDNLSPARAALRNRPGFLEAILTPVTIESTDRDGKTILHLATEAGNLAAVKTILSSIGSGELVNKRDSSGHNSLDIALARLDSRSHIEIAEQLILSGAVSNNRIFNYFAPSVKNANYDLRWADGLTLLHYAAGEGTEGLVTFLIEKKANLNIKNSSGATPLHEAVRSGKVRIVNLLIRNGANIDVQDAKGNSALHIAAPVQNHAEIIKLLLENGANPNLRDEHGDSPLHILIMLNRKLDVVNALLARANVEVSTRNIIGQTPLFLAVEENRVSLIPLLISRGSDIFAENNSGVTPFDRAMQIKGPILEALITPVTARQTDSAGNTILHVAVQNNADTITIGKILDQSANVNARNRKGDTALHIAARTNQKDASEYIISRGADIFSSNSSGESPLYIALANPGGVLTWMFNHQTVAAHDGLGNTMLHYAALWRMDRMIPFIIQQGVLPEAANATGETPLFWAVKYDGASTVRTLLAARANINARDSLGNSSLHAAVQWNAKNAATTLLDLGIDANARSLNGITPLHDAVRLSYTEMIQILISHGANIEIRDLGGNTPFMEAVRGGNIDTINLLARYGADPQTRNANGETPLHIAALTENTQVIQALLNMGGSIHARNTRNRTPFQIALGYSPEMVSALLTNDRVNIPDDFGNSPLHVAIEEKAPLSTIRIIIDKGARLNSLDSNGRIPLRLAVDKNVWDLAKVLADLGSDPFSTASDNKTIAELVLAKGNDAVRAIFSGRAINATDNSGNTILHYAARLGRPEAISLLLELGASKRVKNIAAESPVDIAIRWNKRENAVLLN